MKRAQQQGQTCSQPGTASRGCCHPALSSTHTWGLRPRRSSGPSSSASCTARRASPSAAGVRTVFSPPRRGTQGCNVHPTLLPHPAAPPTHLGILLLVSETHGGHSCSLARRPASRGLWEAAGGRAASWAGGGRRQAVAAQLRAAQLHTQAARGCRAHPRPSRGAVEAVGPASGPVGRGSWGAARVRPCRACRQQQCRGIVRDHLTGSAGQRNRRQESALVWPRPPAPPLLVRAPAAAAGRSLVGCKRRKAASWLPSAPPRCPQLCRPTAQTRPFASNPAILGCPDGPHLAIIRAGRPAGRCQATFD